MKLYEEFKEPSAEWRAKPFWALNGELDESEIRRQIGIFKDMGFGGYFMHSRVGLKTPFLGEKWFDMISAGIDEGKKTGMETWIYDEDRWPSGIAGGYVTVDHRNRIQRLHCIRTKGDCMPTGCLAAFRVTTESGELVSYERVFDYGAIEKDADIFAFCIRAGWAAKGSIGFYNGMSYLDTLSKKAVKKFIEIAYEPYRERFGDEFGSGIKGFFTDEPNRSVFLGTPEGTEWEREGNQYQIPWTEGFEKEFAARKGYDIIGKLPEVFMNLRGEKSSKARWDTSEVTAQLFLEAFPGQISDWCEKNGLCLTGHYLGEDNLYMLMWGAGVVDRFYEPMQVPGIDLISQAVDYIVPKQVQTAARQSGKKFTMCEMYAHSGWGYSLQQYKSYGEWNTVFGINLRCPHLSLYSMAGERKRDCPPTISFQQHWHKEYRAVEDHFARLGIAVSEGEPICELLVVHPVDSISGVILPGWANNKPKTGIEELNKCNASYQTLVRRLMGLQIDFDISEEAVIEKHAHVETDSGEALLVIGKMKYRAVAISRMPSIRKSVFELFCKFQDAGGKIFCVGDRPERIEFGQSFPDSKFTAIKDNAADTKSAFEKYASVKVSENGKDAENIFAMHRRAQDCDVLFLVNLDLANCCRAKIAVSGIGQVQLWDTLSSKRTEVPCVIEAGRTIFDFHFPKGGSGLFAICGQKEKLPIYAPEEPLKISESIEDTFEVTLDMPNVLLLDRPQITIENDAKSPMHILEADKFARDRADLERRCSTMYQPWFKTEILKKNLKEKIFDVTLRYSFIAEYIPNGDAYLALEQPENYCLSMNGKKLAKNDCGYFCDPCIRKIGIESSLIRKGENIIEAVCGFTEETDFEAMYLLGDFGVSANGFELTLTEPVTKLAAGDITSQGLPFYPGSVKYKVSFGDFEKGAKICADEFKGIAVKIRDGENEILLPWHPYETEISQSEVSVELLCSMGNALGIERHAANGYPLSPQGLTAKPKLKIY